LCPSKDDAGRLRRLAGGVADVEALDPERVQVLDREVERVDERTRARLLRALLGEQLGEAQGRALDAHVEPGAARLARLVLHRRADAALRRERLDQRLVDRIADDEERRHAAFEVVLGDECLEDAHLGRLRRLGGDRRVLVDAVGEDVNRALDVLRKVRPVAEMAAGADHREVDAGAAALDLDGEDVGVDDARAGVVLDRLLMQHARQRADPVAQLCCLLELERLGARRHLRLQRVDQLLLLARQESLGVGDVLGVVLGRDVADARPRAALDLVEQARPRPVGEHSVLAGAQVKDLLQQLDRVFHRPRGRERAEVAVLLVDRATVVGDPRKAMRLDLQVRVALVVDEADVEARRQRLDEVVLEQQRLGLERTTVVSMRAILVTMWPTQIAWSLPAWRFVK
jgi:hypothetical protein